MTRRQLAVVWASAAIAFVLLIIPWLVLRVIVSPFVLWNEIRSEVAKHRMRVELAKAITAAIEQKKAIETARQRAVWN